MLVTDLAFGWQSTLLQSGSQIHSLVSFLALPWSWILPESMGVPTLEQIEGSRILLKEGILGLATEHLVARKRAVDRFDFSLPRYKRLVARMRSPQMDIKVRHTRGSIAANRAPLPDPFLENPCNEGWVEEKKEKVPVNGYQKISGLVIGSARVYPESAMASACQALEAQLGVNVTQSCSLSLDLEKDLSLLEPLVPSHGKAPVIMLQEVWQPPIRGVLHYIVQIRQSLFPDRPFWIFLTQTPGADSPGVDNEDINYQVWKTAVAQMNDPDIILERWMS
ncbi:MAG: DUF2868 domain-containing protein [Desulfobacter sp.]|nr:DUF2868 domain-containing protein [Desulfobacter sp.]